MRNDAGNEIYAISSEMMIKCFNFISEVVAAEYGYHEIPSISRITRISEQRMKQPSTERNLERLTSGPDIDVDVKSFYYDHITDDRYEDALNIELFFVSGLDKNSCGCSFKRNKIFSDSIETISIMIPSINVSEDYDIISEQYDAVGTIYYYLLYHLSKQHEETSDYKFIDKTNKILSIVFSRLTGLFEPIKSYGENEKEKEIINDAIDAFTNEGMMWHPTSGEKWVSMYQDSELLANATHKIIDHVCTEMLYD